MLNDPSRNSVSRIINVAVGHLLAQIKEEGVKEVICCNSYTIWVTQKVVCLPRHADSNCWRTNTQ